MTRPIVTAALAHRRTLLGLLLALAFAAGFVRTMSAPAVPALAVPSAPGASGPASADPSPAYSHGFLPTPQAREAHASSLLPLPGGRMMAFWIDGNEGSRDAVISSSTYDPRSGRWSAPTLAASPEQTSADLGLHVRKVGNAIAHRSRDGRLWLFYVSVSVGGWGGSSINLRQSPDEGRTWTPARRLVTTPFLNLSTLVRHATVEYADGSIGVPVYHEFLDMFSQLLRVDRDGRVLDVQRLSDRLTTLQPQLLTRSGNETLVLMRNGGSRMPRHVLRVTSGDGGRTWSSTSQSPLPNPGSPVSGVVLRDGRLLIALNHAESRRRNLSLMLAEPGSENWKLAKLLEDERALPQGRLGRADYTALLESAARKAGAAPEEAARMSKFGAEVRCNADGSCDVEYSYPFLSVADDGMVFLSYTWNRVFTRWLRFDPAWLDAAAPGENH